MATLPTQIGLRCEQEINLHPVKPLGTGGYLLQQIGYSD